MIFCKISIQKTSILKKGLYFFLTLTSAVNAQTFNDKNFEIPTGNFQFSPESEVKNTTDFELVGRVKSAKITKYWISNDTVQSTTLKVKDTVHKFRIGEGAYLEFSEQGNLVLDSYLNNKSFFLRDTYTFDKKGNLTFKYGYYRWKSKKKPYSTEKFLYDNNNNLLEHYIKSNKQKEYILKNRYLYDSKNRMIKHFDLNNHIEFGPLVMCKMGMADFDFIKIYTYNDFGKIEKIETKIYEYLSKRDQAPDEICFKKQKMMFFYYDKNNLVKRVDVGYESPYIGFPRNYYKEFKYGYQNDLLNTYEDSSRTNNSIYKKQTLFTAKNDTIIINTKCFNNSELYSETNLHRLANSNVVIFKERFNKSQLEQTKRYNEDGFLVFEESGKTTVTYELEYDSQKNWVKYYRFLKGKLIAIIIREIEYY